jgi:hypothetical protein
VGSSTDNGFNPSFDMSASNGDDHAEFSAASPIEAPLPPQPLEKPQDAPDAQAQQKVQDVLYSDIGVNTLLNRLKASIASARVCVLIRILDNSANTARTSPASSSAGAAWRKSTPTA